MPNPEISYISKVEGRWNDEITMVIENIPDNFFLSLDGIDVEIVSVVGNTVVWKVPKIAVGLRNLRIEYQQVGSILLEDGNKILLEDSGSLLLEGSE